MFRRTEMIKIERMTEMAKDMSEYNDCAIYVFSNGDDVKIVADRSWFEEAKIKLISQGYQIYSIFQDGREVYA